MDYLLLLDGQAVSVIGRAAGAFRHAHVPSPTATQGAARSRLCEWQVDGIEQQLADLRDDFYQ
jgi:hypothetical protein